MKYEIHMFDGEVIEITSERRGALFTLLEGRSEFVDIDDAIYSTRCIKKVIKI